MRFDSVPAEFEPIAHLVSQVVKRTAVEWSSSCPACGGGNHRNGEPSDRFRMMTVSKIGIPLGWCRKCTYRWFPGKDRKPTQEEKEAWRQEQIRIETEKRDDAQHAINLLNSERIWEFFFSQNNNWSYEILEKRGFSRSWIEYLQFGLNPDFVVWSRKQERWEEYHSPALTIPIWSVGDKVNEVKMRVLNPRSDADRYRAWYKTKTTSLYIPLHDLPIGNVAAVIEGEFKSALVCEKLDNLKISIVGVQSKKPDAQVFQNLSHCEIVYLGLDPDAFVPQYNQKGERLENAVEYCTRLIGKERVRIIEFPCKPDDGILKGMNPMSYIKMARRPL